MFIRAVTIVTLFWFTMTTFAEDKTIIVFDASGSMWGKIAGKTKIESAKKTLENLFSNWDQKKQLGLLAYGHRKKGDCNDIQTIVPIGKVDKDRMISAVNQINPKGKTPISAAIKKAAEELKFTEDNATIILISDGKETCNADPCKTAAELEKLGINFTAHVIGFDVDKETAKQLQCIATKTGGQYFSADNAEQLNKALEKVTKQLTTLTIKAIDENGNTINEEFEWKILNQSIREEAKLFTGNGMGVSLTIVDSEGDQKTNSTVFSGKWLVSVSNGTLSGEKIINISGVENQIVKINMVGLVSSTIEKQESDDPVIIDKTVFNVQSSAIEKISIDGVNDTRSYKAIYELDAELVLQGEEVILDLLPTVKSYSEGIEYLPKLIPGNWKRAYSLNGELNKSWTDNNTSFFNHETLGVFMIKYLLLYIPKNKLKLKDKWKGKLLTNFAPVTVEVTVTTLSKSEIGIKYSSVPILENSQTDSIIFKGNLNGTAVYNKKTLLVKTAKINEKTTFERRINSQKNKLLSERSSQIIIRSE